MRPKDARFRPFERKLAVFLAGLEWAFMSVYLFGQGANFALLVFGLTALVVVEVSLLLYRIVDADKQRRSTIHVATSGGPQQEVAPAYLAGSYLAEGNAKLEMQLTDANRALFMVLMDCCNMITEVGEGSPVANTDAFHYATNMQRSGRTAMSNKEIADHSYQLAAELRAISDPAMTAVRRVLTQLAFSERWDAAFGEAPDAEFDRAPAGGTAGLSDFIFDTMPTSVADGGRTRRNEGLSSTGWKHSG